MQKYIAVVNPRMDDDEISHLIGEGIAGALFEISHQNYGMAARTIRQIQDLSRQHNRPVSIIQDVSSMEDPLDLEFGLQSGVDWVASDKHEHIKLARGLDKLANVIYKGRDLPKGIRVDSIMADGFADPDAQVIGMRDGQIRHLTTIHPNQNTLDSIMDFAGHSGSSAIAVSDLDLAKALSWRRTDKKIIFAPKDQRQAARGAIYWGVHPMYTDNDFITSLKTAKLADKGQRVLDATNVKHVQIHLVP